VSLVRGAAEDIPAPPGAADFVVMGYALRHVADLSVAFREFFRVLAPCGRVCLLEITSPEGAVRRMVLKAYLRGVVPRMARLLGTHCDMPELMRYYWDTIEACAAPRAIEESLRGAGFVEVSRHVEFGVFSEYCARKPQG
jgi:demethylmenaquinone methyltransferase/2-methoxy-6-polyprenyl-1,4-benzoquinol methylase